MSEQDNNQQNNSNKTSKIIIAILAILLLGSVYYIYDLNKTKTAEIVDLTEDRAKIKSELTELIGQYDALLSDKDSLNQELLDERERIVNLLDSVDNVHKSDLARIRRYQSEVSRLKKDKADLLMKADSLIVANEQLIEEKKLVEQSLEQTTQKAQKLETKAAELEKNVALGSILEAQALKANAIKVYRSGRERDTESARRADKIKVCFTLGKNLIAEPGERTIYIRVETPAGTVIAYQKEDSNEFEYNGERRIFSDKKVVEYENEPLDMCVYVDKELDFEEGVYTVDVYAEGAKIGESSFELD